MFAILAVLSFAAAVLVSYRNTDFHILSHTVSCLGAGARRAACDRVFSGSGNRIRKKPVRRGGNAACARRGGFWLSSAPLLAVTSLASIGSALLIASSERGPSMAGRLLSLRPIVFIGLISYSLYLWHWPLIVFQRTDGLLVADASSTTTELVLIVASIGVACLSWKFVELPFRSKAKDTPRPRCSVSPRRRWPRPLRFAAWC